MAWLFLEAYYFCTFIFICLLEEKINKQQEQLSTCLVAVSCWLLTVPVFFSFDLFRHN